MERGVKILIFDDDFTTLKIQSKILSRMGYQVFTCDTAVDIFNTIEKYAPDVILMDHEMPLMTGIEAIKHLKANILSQPIPIILFSLYEHLADQAINAGAALYVSKASSFDRLTDAINSLVSRPMER